MIRLAIFNTESDAIAYSNKVHQYLQANRPNYNAVKWADPIQSADGIKWTVKLPVEELEDRWDNPINTEVEKSKAEGITLDLPEIGQPCEINTYYLYKGDVLKCRQSHNRTIYKPKDTPNLFSYFRDNSDDLKWIPNEEVEAGWVRIYEGIKYEVIQPHQTQSDWTPVNTLGNLWKVYEEASDPTELPPQWNTANWIQYVVGYRVVDSGKIWEAINTTHTWIQPALEGNGAISWKFIQDV